MDKFRSLTQILSEYHDAFSVPLDIHHALTIHGFAGYSYNSALRNLHGGSRLIRKHDPKNLASQPVALARL